MSSINKYSINFLSEVIPFLQMCDWVCLAYMDLVLNQFISLKTEEKNCILSG